MLDNVEEHLDLSVNTDLQYIHIVLPEFVGAMSVIFATRCRALSVYAIILSQVASPTLREVILSEGPEHTPHVIDMASCWAWRYRSPERKAVRTRAEGCISIFQLQGRRGCEGVFEK